MRRALSWFDRIFRRPTRTPSVQHANRIRLNVEQMEDRCVPATFTVNTSLDTPDMNIGDGLALDAAGNTSLRAAIQEGNAIADANVTINFSAQVFGPANPNLNLGIILPTLNKNYTINGLGEDNLVIRRNTNAAGGEFRIFEIAAGKSVEIHELTISNGIGSAVAGTTTTYGGGIFNYGTLLIHDVTMESNSANVGGAIYNADGASLTVGNSHIYLNQAYPAPFFGFSFGGGIANAGHAHITHDSQIYSNTADNGGGIFNYANAQMTIDGGAEIYGNQALAAGGGIYNVGTLTMRDAFLYVNEVTANDGKGGGLYNRTADSQPQATATLTNVEIERNEASGNAGKGGGVYARSGTVTVTQSTLVDNECGAGNQFDGGCFWFGANLTFTNMLQMTDGWGVDPDSI